MPNGNGVPPPPVNRIPNGLLDFLGIKSGGRNPDALSSGLAATLDLLQWYAYTASEDFQVVRTTGIAAGGATRFNWEQSIPAGLIVAATLPVPQDQIWIVLEYEVLWQFNAIAGEVFDGAPSYELSAGGSIIPPNTLFGFTSSIAALQQGGARDQQGAVWARPGTLLQFRTAGTQTATTINSVQGRLRIVRLQI